MGPRSAISSRPGLRRRDGHVAVAGEQLPPGAGGHAAAAVPAPSGSPGLPEPDEVVQRIVAEDLDLMAAPDRACDLDQATLPWAVEAVEPVDPGDHWPQLQ